MLQNLKKKYNLININNINSFVFFISLILFIISVIFINNLYITVLIYLFLYFIKNKENQKVISFLTDATGIVLLAYFLLNFMSFSYSKIILNTFLFIIKGLYILNYFWFVLMHIKNKKVKYYRKKKRKKYTFKELREKNTLLFKNKTKKAIDDYVENQNIELNSDYSNLLENNLDDKSLNDLEEYVWLNYLRFYKHKRYDKEVLFDKLNLVFLMIHVIILLLVFLVR